MWLFSETGFVSAVMDEDNPDQIVVRARDKKSLEPLAKFAGVKIVKLSRVTDYPHRVFVPRSKYAEWVLELIGKLEYTNYKSRVTETRGHDFADPLHDVWATMLQLEYLGPNKKNKKGWHTEYSGGFSMKDYYQTGT
jgi:hypothetical protein